MITAQKRRSSTCSSYIEADQSGKSATKVTHPRQRTEVETANGNASLIAGSKRQQEVLDLLFRGFTYREIANLLVISEDTIRTYIKRLYRRLEVTSRSEAVFEAQRTGLLR